MYKCTDLILKRLNVNVNFIDIGIYIYYLYRGYFLYIIYCVLYILRT